MKYERSGRDNRLKISSTKISSMVIRSKSDESTIGKSKVDNIVPTVPVARVIVVSE